MTLFFCVSCPGLSWTAHFKPSRREMRLKMPVFMPRCPVIRPLGRIRQGGGCKHFQKMGPPLRPGNRPVPRITADASSSGSNNDPSPGRRARTGKIRYIGGWVGRSVGRWRRGHQRNGMTARRAAGYLSPKVARYHAGARPPSEAPEGPLRGEDRLTLRVQGPPPDSVFLWQLVRTGEGGGRGGFGQLGSR